MLVPRDAINALVLKNPRVNLRTAPLSNLLLSFSAIIININKNSIRTK